MKRAERCEAHGGPRPCDACAAVIERQRRAARHREWLETEVRRALRGMVPETRAGYVASRRSLARELDAYVRDEDPGFAPEAIRTLAALPLPDADPDVVERILDMLEAAARRGAIGAAADERARIIALLREHRLAEATIDRLLNVPGAA